MDANEVKTQIEGIAQQIDQKLDAAAKAAEAKQESAAKAYSEEVTKLVAKHSELQKHIDDMATAMARKTGLNSSDGDSATDLIRKALESSDAFAKMRENQGKGRATIELSGKAVLNTATNAVGLIQADRQGIVYQQQRRPSVLDLIPTTPTTSNAIEYPREVSYTSNGTYVPEGTMKPEDGFVFDLANSPVKTLATTVRITKQMMDDTPGLVGYLNARIPRKLDLVKEQNVLFGNGSATQLQGITPLAAAYAAPLVQADATNMDVLMTAIAQAAMAEYEATGVVVHYLDLLALRMAKDSQGRYLFPELRENGTIDGVRLATTKLTAMRNKFLAADFGMGAMLHQRQGMTLEFFDQDRDNVPLNLITVRAEERHALAIYRPDAFVYGDFTAAKADLAS